ncbi:hypothetical protein [Nocardia paucivorans]|uniref:hypothetical protein n=1 Tax=Nocardia paucivorans TaxID=114259 RepID=UPI00031115BD|nr:hypothetical protein [Nocardia paucivorans]
MVNHSDDIVGQAERLTRNLLATLEEQKRRSAAEMRELNEQSAQRIQAAMKQHVQETATKRAEVRDQPSVEQPRPAADTQVPRVDESYRLRDEEIREQREAMARSAAARRANNVVTPIDDDGDEEAEYYRRSSWLV